MAPVPQLSTTWKCFSWPYHSCVCPPFLCPIVDVKWSLTRHQLLPSNFGDHTCWVSLAWWHGVPQGAWTGSRRSVSHWRLRPLLHFGRPPPTLSSWVLRNHSIQIHTQTHTINTSHSNLICYVRTPFASFHSFALFASATLGTGAINTWLDLFTRSSPPGDDRDCALLPWSWRFPLCGMEWEYTERLAMAPFQDVPCTIKLCSARYDGFRGSLFGMQ